jgi:hypothetical protein
LPLVRVPLVRDPYQRALSNLAARIENAYCLLCEDLASKRSDVIELDAEEVETAEYQALEQLGEARRELANCFMIIRPSI